MTATKVLRRKYVRPALTLVVAAIVVGCTSGVELGDVQGTVKMDGKPLSGATIRFVPVNGGRAAFGRTDESGKYEIQYSATASGALVGQVRVEITTAEEVSDKLGRSRMKPEIVPSRYNTESTLIREVGSGDNTFDFELQSK